MFRHVLRLGAPAPRPCGRAQRRLRLRLYAARGCPGGSQCSGLAATGYLLAWATLAVLTPISSEWTPLSLWKPQKFLFAFDVPKQVFFCYESAFFNRAMRLTCRTQSPWGPVQPRTTVNLKLPKSEMSLSLTDLPGRSPGVGRAQPLQAKTEVHPSRAHGQLQTQRQVVPSAVCVSELVHALLGRQPRCSEKLSPAHVHPEWARSAALCLPPARGEGPKEKGQWVSRPSLTSCAIGFGGHGG